MSALNPVSFAGHAAWMAALVATACTQAPLPKPPALQPTAPRPAVLGAVAAPGPLASSPVTSKPFPVPAAASVRTLRQFAWGTGPAQLGRVLQGEQNPEGPMAIDADAQGRVFVLDQVNARVLRLDADGTLHSVGAPRAAQELLAGPSGVWLLDRLVGLTALRVDTETGKELGHLGLTQPQLDEPGGITALIGHDGGLWAEFEHTRLIRLGGLDGATLAPASLAGRPGLDARRLLRALRTAPGQVAITGRALEAPDSTAPNLTLQAEFPLPVWQVLELAGDQQGRVWLVVDAVAFDAQDKPAQRRRIVRVWNADGAPRAAAELCTPDGPEETLRPVRLGANGRLYALCVRSDGATVQEVSL